MLEIMRGTDFEKALKETPKSGYLLFGDEDYLKSHALSRAREILCPDPAFAPFNDLRLDALDFTPDKLLDALMPLPMMADRKLVTISGLFPSQMNQNEIEAVCRVLETLEEYDYNTLIWVVPAGAIDEGYLPKRPSALLTKLSAHLVPVRFEKVSPAKLAGWVGKHYAHSGVEASPEICRATVDYCGTDMYALSSEVEKVAAFVLAHGRASVTGEDLRLAAIPAVEFDSFAFSDALLNRKSDRALEILRQMKMRRAEPVLILGEVTRFFCDLAAVSTMVEQGAGAAEISAALKIHEYRVGLYIKAAANMPRAALEAALAACDEADTALKQSPQGYTALERLLCTV